MNYCVSCNLHLKAAEITNPNACPKCSHEIREISNTKLIDLLAGLELAAKNLTTSTLKANPKKLVELAKIIERGEKSLSKEFSKRIELLKVIKYEQSVIEAFAIQMGYKEKNLVIVEQEEETEDNEQ